MFEGMGLLRVDNNIHSEIRKLLQGPLDLERISIGLDFRYIGDLIRVTLFPSSLRMMFAEVRLWKGPIWDVFNLGLQFQMLADGECRIYGMCRAIRFDVVFPFDFIVEQLDRITVKIVEDIVSSQGESYQRTIDAIRDAYLQQTQLLYRGAQTWEVDWQKYRGNSTGSREEKT
jgi:hypothetical protein